MIKIPEFTSMTSLPSLLAVLVLIGGIAPGQARGADSGVIVLYHHVATDTPPSTTISPADFRRHLEYLRDNEYNIMALDDMVEALRDRESIPDKSVAITFDDGYISIYEEAFPMLQSFGFPFTLFLSTGPIDENQRNYMNWDQVRELSDAGAIIANHMVEHPYMLERQGNESDEQWISRLRLELLAAERAIESNTGQSHRYLAYPYGEFDTEIKDMLSREGFTGFAQNSGAMGHNSDFLALPRYPLASIYANLDTARTKFASLAFNAELVEPLSPVTTRRDPAVTLRFNPGNYRLEQIGCFAESTALPLEWIDRDEGLLRITPDREYQGRRWRYICTAPDPGSNRYYWYSVQWIQIAE